MDMMVILGLVRELCSSIRSNYCAVIQDHFFRCKIFLIALMLAVFYCIPKCIVHLTRFSIHGFQDWMVLHLWYDVKIRFYLSFVCGNYPKVPYLALLSPPKPENTMKRSIFTLMLCSGFLNLSFFLINSFEPAWGFWFFLQDASGCWPLHHPMYESRICIQHRYRYILDFRFASVAGPLSYSGRQLLHTISRFCV